MALDYDFFLGGLGFTTAVTKDRPYERATAQFRKDQSDTTATVGDQSLTGWWTRGQLSFHKGAGVKYYEVLGDGDKTVENRFHVSESVDPSTPGEVALAGKLETAYSTSTNMVAATVVHIPNIGTASPPFDGTFVYRASGSWGGLGTNPADTSLHTALGSSLVGVAGDEQYQYAATATMIKRGPTVLALPLVHTNAWAPPASNNWDGIFWAKSRLFAVTDLGYWFWFAPGTTGTAAIVDAFWASGIQDNAHTWRMTESPGAVYLSFKSTIYSIGVGSDGLIPDITAPTVVAGLPVNETIQDISYYLGRIVISTDHGVRVALVQADGSLAVGPRVVEGDFQPYQCARIGDAVWIAGTLTDETNTSIVAIDMAEDVTSLQPAWRRVYDLGSAGRGGVSLTEDGEAIVWNSSGVRRVSTSLQASGTLTTGFHRLGTLEPKAFRLLRVRTEGTQGSIDVSVNASDGTTYTVGTVAAGDTEEFDLATIVGFPSALEYLSITFTLNRGASTGPTLLGYQLKALPVPKRQRMLRVPLALMDSETNRRKQVIAHRNPGVTDPWTRLAALEALEESNAVVTFQDKLTGETGSAYIESVEVTRTANDDFGGFVFVTLRVV